MMNTNKVTDDEGFQAKFFKHGLHAQETSTTLLNQIHYQQRDDNTQAPTEGDSLHTTAQSVVQIFPPIFFKTTFYVQFPSSNLRCQERWVQRNVTYLHHHHYLFSKPQNPIYTSSYFTFYILLSVYRSHFGASRFVMTTMYSAEPLTYFCGLWSFVGH